MIKIETLILELEQKLKNLYEKVDEISLYNQQKVLNAFRKNRVSCIHFQPSTGYGYDDISRDTLNKLFADIFNTDKAIVSPLISSGTHALTIGLFGILRPGDRILCVTGKPYDTLNDVFSGVNIGSLADFNVIYEEIDLLDDSTPNYKAIEKAVKEKPYKAVFLTRSEGYSWRPALSIEVIQKVNQIVKKHSINHSVITLVDNCYGEFVETQEPTDVGIDVVIGSLIKNPGGGISPTGGYICGKEEVINQIASRFTSPAVGAEIGSYNASYLPFYMGLFRAPSTVANAIKGSLLFGAAFDKLGFDVNPKAFSLPNDIIRAIKFDSKEKLISFIQQIQASSPIDSYVVPCPWAMPGYSNDVIMAAGTFIQGASIELSSDSPVKEPYIAYLQGGLSYEHCKIALKESLKYFI